MTDTKNLKPLVEDFVKANNELTQALKTLEGAKAYVKDCKKRVQKITHDILGDTEPPKQEKETRKLEPFVERYLERLQSPIMSPPTSPEIDILSTSPPKKNGRSKKIVEKK